MTKSLTRKELAEAAGVSVDTIDRWLDKIRPKLMDMGYKKHQRLFTPKQIEFILEHFCIEMREKPP